MKVMTSAIFGLMLTAQVWAGPSYEEATQLFDTRGENYSNALKAAEMYGQLATTESEGSSKAEALMHQSESLYYYAFTVPDNNEKKKWHKVGEDVAMDAAKLYNHDGDKELEALGYSWAGAHLGQWGLANGILASLFKVPTLKSYMAKIEELGQNPVNSYGHHRVLGRLLFKLPWPQGDKAKSLGLFKEAFEKTMSKDFGVSTYGLNVVYYAEALIDSGDKALAKDILAKFVAITDYQSYNETRIPETKAEQKEAKDLLQGL
jgi:hypothetical protein